MNKALSNKITYISFAAAIGVMYIHAIDYTSYSPELSGWKIIAFIEQWIGQSMFGHACVSLFFIISGYLLFLEMNNFKDYRRKLVKRIKTLIVPYIFWAFTGYLIFVFINACGFSSNLSAKLEFNTSVFYDVFIELKYSHHLWYIQNLTIYFIVSAALLYVLKYHKFSFLLLVVCLILSVCGVELGFFKLTRFTAFFCGAYIQRFHSELPTLRYKKSISILAGLLLALLSIMSLVTNISLFDKVWYFLSPIFMWIGFDSFNIDFFEKNILLKKIKGDSFYLYCGHGTTIECVKQVFSLIGGVSSITMLMSYILSPLIIATVLFSLLMVGRKLFPGFISLITGNRS